MAVQRVEENALERAENGLPAPKAPTREIERDILQWHVVTGQGRMAGVVLH